MTERETLERAVDLVWDRVAELEAIDANKAVSQARADAAALRDLAGEIEALRRDAERYRWLRSTVGEADVMVDIVPTGGDWSSKTVLEDGDELDAAIDRAIAEGKG